MYVLFQSHLHSHVYSSYSSIPTTTSSTSSFFIFSCAAFLFLFEVWRLIEEADIRTRFPFDVCFIDALIAINRLFRRPSPYPPPPSPPLPSTTATRRTTVFHEQLCYSVNQNNGRTVMSRCPPS